MQNTFAFFLFDCNLVLLTIQLRFQTFELHLTLIAIDFYSNFPHFFCFFLKGGWWISLINLTYRPEYTQSILLNPKSSLSPESIIWTATVIYLQHFGQILAPLNKAILGSNQTKPNQIKSNQTKPNQMSYKYCRCNFNNPPYNAGACSVHEAHFKPLSDQ